MSSASIGSFEKLVAWQEAHKLTLLIYKVTENFPTSERFNLISQLRRAAVSIESCIAEGFCRYHYKDKLVFSYDARGSVGEVQSQLIDSRDLEFLSEVSFNNLYSQAEKTGVVLGGLIRSTAQLAVRS